MYESSIWNEQWEWFRARFHGLGMIYKRNQYAQRRYKVASINELAVTAYSLGEIARELQIRLQGTEEIVKKDNAQLAALTQGSRSGQNAVQQVNAAIKAMETAVRNIELMRIATDKFIQDLQS